MFGQITFSRYQRVFWTAREGSKNLTFQEFQGVGQRDQHAESCRNTCPFWGALVLPETGFFYSPSVDLMFLKLEGWFHVETLNSDFYQFCHFLPCLIKKGLWFLSKVRGVETWCLSLAKLLQTEGIDPPQLVILLWWNLFVNIHKKVDAKCCKSFARIDDNLPHGKIIERLSWFWCVITLQIRLLNNKPATCNFSIWTFHHFLASLALQIKCMDWTLNNLTLNKPLKTNPRRWNSSKE